MSIEIRYINPTAPSRVSRLQREPLKRPKPLKRKTYAESLAKTQFRSLTDNIKAIVRACNGEGVDPRLKPVLARAPSGLTGMDPTLGGFLIAPEFSQDMPSLIYDQAPLASLCDRRETKNPLAEVKVPGIDETSRADGSRHGGVLAYWPQEGTTVPSVFPRFKMIEFSGKKVMALVLGTNELMNDAPMFESHINDVVTKEFAFQLDRTILSGNGVGTPLGVLGANALITIPKIAGQAAKTIVNENISAMWASLPGPSRGRAVWLVNEDADGQLNALTTGGNPNTYVPAGLFGNEYPLLKGRPVLCIEQCPQLGTVGDIVLADMSHYIVVDGGLKPAISLHVDFVHDQAVLRFSWWVDGRSTFATPITPYNGSTPRSPFITLGAR